MRPQSDICPDGKVLWCLAEQQLAQGLVLGRCAMVPSLLGTLNTLPQLLSLSPSSLSEQLEPARKPPHPLPEEGWQAGGLTVGVTAGCHLDFSEAL